MVGNIQKEIEDSAGGSNPSSGNEEAGQVSSYGAEVDGGNSGDKSVSNETIGFTAFKDLNESFNQHIDVQLLDKKKYAQMLLGLLAKAYKNYALIKDKSSPDHKMAADDFYDFGKSKNLEFKKNTKLVSKIIKCVLYKEGQKFYGSKISNYGDVIYFAEKNNVTPENFAKYVEEGGGIQKVRLSSYGSLSNPQSVKDRIKLAKAFLKEEEVGEIDAKSIEEILGEIKKEGDTAIILYKDATGSVVIKAKIDESEAVDVVYQAYFKQFKGKITGDETGEGEANDFESFISDGAG